MLLCQVIVLFQVLFLLYTFQTACDSAGPVLESLMSMKNLPSSASAALQGGPPKGSPRGQPLKRVQEGDEGETSGDEEQGPGDKLNSLPSVTASQSSTQVCQAVSEQPNGHSH